MTKEEEIIKGVLDATKNQTIIWVATNSIFNNDTYILEI